MQLQDRRTRTLISALLVCLLMPGAVALAQEHSSAATATPANPLTEHSKSVYSGLKMIVLRAAESTPEENYGFRPTEAVRTFGQIVGHMADAQYTFCSVARGEANPAPKVEKTKASKADLIAALRDAFVYCDKAYEGMTDASGAELVKFHWGDTPRLGILNVNEIHTTEHYGNLVTYMRMKGLVPPSSAPEFMKELMK